MSVSEPIGPERPAIVAWPSRVSAKLVTMYGPLVVRRGDEVERAELLGDRGLGRGREAARRIGQRCPLDLGQVFDVGAVVVVALGRPPNQASRISPSSASEVARRLSARHVGVVPAPRAVGGRGVDAQRGPDPGDLVGRDRGPGPGPAADDRLLGAPRRRLAGGRLARPRPVVALAVGQCPVRERLVPAAAQLVDQRPAIPTRSSAATAIRIVRSPRGASAAHGRGAASAAARAGSTGSAR